MKKRILLLTIFGAFVYFLSSSFSSGLGAHGYNRTGTQDSIAGCGSAAAGCHGTGGGTSVYLQFYSPINFQNTVGSYLANHPYAIVITGTNSSISSSHQHGFQLCAVTGTGSAQTTVGTWSTPAAQYQISSVGSVNPIDIVEQAGTITTSASLSAGVHDTLYWTAPPSGAGTVKFYCSFLAVNNNSLADTVDAGAMDSSLSVTENTSSVKSISENTVITAYPNPFSSQFRLQMDHAEAGIYTVKAYDMSGKNLIDNKVQVSSNSFETSINTANWAPGFYGIQIINNEGAQRFIPVIKQ